MESSPEQRIEGFYRVRMGQRIEYTKPGGTAKDRETFGGGQRVPAGHPCVARHRHLLCGDPEEPPRRVGGSQARHSAHRAPRSSTVGPPPEGG